MKTVSDWDMSEWIGGIIYKLPWKTSVLFFLSFMISSCGERTIEQHAYQCLDVRKVDLIDPFSVKLVTSYITEYTSIPIYKEGSSRYRTVTIDYRAKNAFGAYIQNEYTCYLDKQNKYQALYKKSIGTKYISKRLDSWRADN
jgi:hypothetical protein